MKITANHRIIHGVETNKPDPNDPAKDPTQRRRLQEVKTYLPGETLDVSDEDAKRLVDLGAADDRFGQTKVETEEADRKK